MAKTKESALLPARDLLDLADQICSRLPIPALRRQAALCADLLGEDRPIDVAVLGQFKAGKSSFLNSLLDGPVLPVGVVPVTAVITRLRYGPAKRAVVTYLDGSQAEIPLESLAEFTSEAGNPRNAKDVEAVDVEMPNLSAWPGIRLVDTPGLGGVFKGHQEIARRWLPEVGAAIVAVSAERPLSEQDLELIRDLARHTPRVALLLTKVDLLLPDQQKEVVGFLERSLEDVLGRRLPIFCFSTRLDTDRYRRRLETEILLDLSRNRDLEFRHILRYKLRSLGLSCVNYLEIALRSAQKAQQERQALRERILDERLSLKAIEEDLMLIGRENARQTRTLIMQHLGRREGPLQEKLAEELRGELPKWKGNLWRLTRRYEDWLRERMTAEMKAVSREESGRFLGILKKAQAAFERNLLSFRALLGQNIEGVLGVKLGEANWQIEVEAPARPDIGFVRVFDFHFDLLWFLIPMFLFRPLFERRFLNLVPRAVEMNLSRLAAQWEERINAAIEEMRRQAAALVAQETTTIETLLAADRGRLGEIEAWLSGMRERLAALEEKGEGP